ncbi:hypothetical protein DSO57_1027966 [Entomophthora muscae]|uniref:Uncharacterized protein n=1 Tax=Entomophthora muscae TaxID=34485 RepID=A0ACC2UAM0_9FUNG|nr:hypothetical protein DSO57_1027966 [Entomophthora muscae]
MIVGFQRYHFINRKLVVDIARALKANPDFEKIRRQTIQQSRRSLNVGRPCPTPAGMLMSMTYPVMPRPASSSSSSSMSPPASFPSNSSNNAWSMAPAQPAPITSRVRDQPSSSSSTVNSRKSEVFPSRPPNAKKPNNAHKG